MLAWHTLVDYGRRNHDRHHCVVVAVESELDTNSLFKILEMKRPSTLAEAFGFGQEAAKSCRSESEPGNTSRISQASLAVRIFTFSVVKSDTTD